VFSAGPELELKMQILNVARDFSAFPAGRFYDDGKFSGERFREEYLKKFAEMPGEVKVELDGTEGYGSSFLDEAFGGLVRKGYISSQDFKKKFSLESSDRALIKEIIEYVDGGA
jgi:hypothetical protein